MTDFIFMVGASHMFITGPDAIKTVTGEEVEFEELGGAMTHNSKSGVAHFAAEDEEACLEDAHTLMSYLPQEQPRAAAEARHGDPHDRMDPELDAIVPDNPNKPYDMRDVVTRIVDDEDFFEVQSTSRATSSSASSSWATARSGSTSAANPLSSPACSASRRERGSTPVRALLRRVQHPAAHVLRRAQLPSRHPNRE